MTRTNEVLKHERSGVYRHKYWSSLEYAACKYKKCSLVCTYDVLNAGRYFDSSVNGMEILHLSKRDTLGSVLEATFRRKLPEESEELSCFLFPCFLRMTITTTLVKYLTFSYQLYKS